MSDADRGTHDDARRHDGPPPPQGPSWQRPPSQAPTSPGSAAPGPTWHDDPVSPAAGPGSALGGHPAPAPHEPAPGSPDYAAFAYGSTPAPKRRHTGFIAAGVALVVLFGCIGAYLVSDNLGRAVAPGAQGAAQREASTWPTGAAPVQQADASAPDWTATAAAVSPSVVSITVSQGGQGGQGSGVVLDSQGRIVTNHHVVAAGGSNATIVVTLNDKRAYQAKIVGTDPATDLAVLALDNPPDDLRPVSMGNSDDLKVGAPVMAVGNPLGLAGTVTTGIVSALNRPVTTQQQSSGSGSAGGGEVVVTNAIQTSAAINPGNSGGALVNATGQLVGINSSIASVGASGPGGESGNIGIGFAIPVNEARSVTQQIITSGSVKHPFVGLLGADGLARESSTQRAAAIVKQVTPGSPAAQAGLRPGDAVVAVNGEIVDSWLSLVAQVREQNVGQQITLTIIRNGQRSDVKATLTERPSGS